MMFPKLWRCTHFPDKWMLENTGFPDDFGDQTGAVPLGAVERHAARAVGLSEACAR